MWSVYFSLRLEKLHLSMIKHKSGRSLSSLALIWMNQKMVSQNHENGRSPHDYHQSKLFSFARLQGVSFKWKQKVFPLHTILEFFLLLRRHKVSWNWSQKQFCMYLKKKKKKRQALPFALWQLQGHDGHSCYCCLWIHLGTGTLLKERALWWRPCLGMTQGNTAKIHDIWCCFSTLCFWLNLLEYWNRLEAD